MEINVDFNAFYVPSEDVVVRDIEGELLIVPLTSGIGDIEDALFTLNETGRAIWEHLNGKKNLKSVMEELYKIFDAPPEEIEKDVSRFIAELLKRKILVEA